MSQFNHVDPDKKHNDYDNLIRRNISADQLDELDKCVLMCNQCHGILHGQNITSSMTLTVTMGDRTVSQTFKGQAIFDKIERKLAFFCDGEMALHINPLIWPGSCAARRENVHEDKRNTPLDVLRRHGQIAATR